MNYAENTMNLAMTFQMSLDCFVKENKQIYKHNDALIEALQHLEKVSQFRSFEKKRTIAKEALEFCPDCIEAYYALGCYTKSCFTKMEILKKGMEKATLLLGKDFFLQNRDDFYECKDAHAFFQIKFAYALTLFESGYMKKAKQQLREIINLNPSDHFKAHELLYAVYLHFEDHNAMKELMERYPQRDTLYLYVLFLKEMKLANYNNAKLMIPLLKQSNHYLFEIVSQKRMNTLANTKQRVPGSEEEAAYVYQLLQRQFMASQQLAIFLLENENQ